ncbi:MAG: hypothetical protein IKG56_00525 [Clostridia bacterium]|nr:hypothetical protein [Clostridia bacterium]
MDNEGDLKEALDFLDSYNMDNKAQAANTEPEKEQESDNKFGYPPELADTSLERRYIGLLLNEIKAISVYYFLFDDCFFVDDLLLNIYKKILFTDGEKYAPVIAKEKFNFSKESQELYEVKNMIKDEFYDSKYRLDDTYTELKKIFILRKNYLGIPVKDIQAKIADVLNYELYHEMTPEDVESAVEQIASTEKFKRSVLNKDLTKFLVEGDNTLTNGLELPFPIMTKAFKGIRIGETAAFSMPSNYGKSRFTINLAAYIALVHQKKVLIISNEMSEEKMKLCLITTILNNPTIQKMHNQNVHVSENQLLEFKFRPDDVNSVEVDENGFVKQGEGENHYDFANRLAQISSEFRNVIRVTNWFNDKLYNSIHFIDITDHTNDELKKVIMNYYYKEQVHYVFYDTLKTDIDNIGNGEELKKTATILSNLAQNFGMYIGSSLQLSETQTDPVNLSVNDMAVSRTVKEVLDTLCLFKQIHNEDLGRYEYSTEETFENVHDIERFKNPDIRYYSCVIDKNRAGPKPVLLFKINLAYNSWEELGYLRLKSASV